MRYLWIWILYVLWLPLNVLNGQTYVLRSDFEKVLKARDADASLDDSLKVFRLSELYSAYIDGKELAVYNYYKNKAVIRLGYIWNTTTNNHWIQLALGENEEKVLELILNQENGMAPHRTKVEGLKGSSVSFVGNKLRLSVKGGMAQRGMIVVDGNESEPLFIFVDAPQTVSASDSAVVLDGYHKGTYKVPPSVNRISIPLGAYYRGNIISDHDIQVDGLGIISQEGIKHSGYEKDEDNPFKCNVAVRGNDTRMKITGVTSIEPAMYHFWVWPGNGTVYEGVKAFSFLYETDAYIGSQILDCFSKVNDDNVKLYISDIKVERLSTYLQGNGHTFQFGWGNYGSRKNIRVKDITVFRDLNNQKECKYVRSFINWRKPDVPNVIEDVCFENIRFYAPVRSFCVMDNDGKSWLSTPEVRNFVIKNVRLPQKPYCLMKIENPSFHVQVEDFLIDGVSLTNENVSDYISNKSLNNFIVK